MACSTGSTRASAIAAAAQNNRIDRPAISFIRLWSTHIIRLPWINAGFSLPSRYSYTVDNPAYLSTTDHRPHKTHASYCLGKGAGDRANAGRSLRCGLPAEPLAG